MKYYFVKEITGDRHIVVAKNEEDLKAVLKNADVVSTNFYELKEDTFKKSGFLISDNS